MVKKELGGDLSFTQHTCRIAFGIILLLVIFHYKKVSVREVKCGGVGSRGNIAEAGGLQINRISDLFISTVGRYYRE